MRILLDTNILLRLGDKSHPMHATATEAVNALHKNGHVSVLVPQVLYEYWVVATRPAAVNGLGMDVTLVDQVLAEWLAVYPLLHDERRVFEIWRDLVTAHQVKGKNAHDTRLVAAMQRHGVQSLLTFNVADFTRFSTIDVYSPAEILAGRIPT